MQGLAELLVTLVLMFGARGPNLAA